MRGVTCTGEREIKGREFGKKKVEERKRGRGGRERKEKKGRR